MQIQESGTGLRVKPESGSRNQAKAQNQTLNWGRAARQRWEQGAENKSRASTAAGMGHSQVMLCCGHCKAQVDVCGFLSQTGDTSIWRRSHWAQLSLLGRLVDHPGSGQLCSCYYMVIVVDLSKLPTLLPFSQKSSLAIHLITNKHTR